MDEGAQAAFVQESRIAAGAFRYVQFLLCCANIPMVPGRYEWISWPRSPSGSVVTPLKSLDCADNGTRAASGAHETIEDPLFKLY